MLQRFRFTNVQRELDRGTIGLTYLLREHLNGLPGDDALDKLGRATIRWSPELVVRAAESSTSLGAVHRDGEFRAAVETHRARTLEENPTDKAIIEAAKLATDAKGRPDWRTRLRASCCRWGL